MQLYLVYFKTEINHSIILTSWYGIGSVIRISVHSISIAISFNEHLECIGTVYCKIRLQDICRVQPVTVYTVCSYDNVVNVK